MEVESRRVVAYLMHDPIANMEGYITDYSEDSLRGAEECGIVLIAEYSDGSREIVKANEVRKPEPQANGISLATPEYVDARAQATVAVFDALSAIVNPEAVECSADGDESEEVADPIESFATALAALKSLVSGEVG